MLRAVVEFAVVIIAGYFIRAVLGIIMGALNPMAQKQQSPPPPPSAGTPQRPPAAAQVGELKKDPVCGTFVSTSTALQKSSRGETYYFCSQECRDKFRG